jgi:hypothetical protein
MERFKYTDEELNEVLDTVGIQKKDTVNETMNYDNLDLDAILPKIQSLEERAKLITICAIVDRNYDEAHKQPERLDFLKNFKEELDYLRQNS